MTLREYAESRPEGAHLDGVVLAVPRRYRQPGMKAEMALCSVWSAGEKMRGVWLGFPGERTGRRFPVPNVPLDDLLSWEVV
jgi:hypothetical protein